MKNHRVLLSMLRKMFGRIIFERVQKVTLNKFLECSATLCQAQDVQSRFLFFTEKYMNVGKYYFMCIDIEKAYQRIDFNLARI